MGKDYWNLFSNLIPRISNIINCYSPVTCHLQFCTAQSRVLEYLHKSDMPHFEKPGARVLKKYSKDVIISVCSK